MSELVAPRACVVIAPGINCNDETAAALEMAGAIPEQVHISQLMSGERQLSDFQITAFSGGFSRGDHLGSGKIMALELQTRLGEQVTDFVENRHGLVIGICNGFQVLVKSGLLPTGHLGEEQSVTLTDNAQGRFECRWSRLRVEDSASPFLLAGDYDNELIELPIAHGEGRFLTREVGTSYEIIHGGQVALRYSTANGQPAETFPDNPNGSLDAIAGICDPSGRILGMMPHPERFVRREQHPNHRRQPELQPAGLPIFQNMVRYAIKTA